MLTTFFYACALLGGGVLLLMLVLSTFGAEHELGHDAGGHLDAPVHHDGWTGALNLRSPRALAAGIAFFGVTGMISVKFGLPAVLTLAPATVVGLAAAYTVSWVLRGLTQLERDGVIDLADAVGESAITYLSIPARGAGAGKVTLTLSGRRVQIRAITDGPSIPTGAHVRVLDLVTSDTVRVAATSGSEEYFDGSY
jgi:hypothetical protein